MLVIAVEKAPPALRGRLVVWLLEIRAGIYVGTYSRKVREAIWAGVLERIGDGNAAVAWAAPTDAGFEFDTCGRNRCVPVELDGMKFVRLAPEAVERKPAWPGSGDRASRRPRC